VATSFSHPGGIQLRCCVMPSGVWCALWMYGNIECGVLYGAAQTKRGGVNCWWCTEDSATAGGEESKIQVPRFHKQHKAFTSSMMQRDEYSNPERSDDGEPATNQRPGTVLQRRAGGMRLCKRLTESQSCSVL
jgi:hypothetical protein